MIIPVRCYTCGKPISTLWEEYKKKVDKGIDPNAALDELGVEKYCCRRMLLSHINLIDEVIKFGPEARGKKK